MVRLFVPPGEGKEWICPKRCEPLPGNATPTYALLSSTALAAAYTALQRHHTLSAFGSASHFSSTTAFIRSSAKAGVCCAVIGATVNWYYHKAFCTPILRYRHKHKSEDLKWRLFTDYDNDTVDDFMMLGGVTGLTLGAVWSVASLAGRAVRRLRGSSALRIAPTMWWTTRCIGLANVGAAAGICTGHGFFQYTGERSKVVEALENWNRRRNLEFWTLVNMPSIISSLNLLAQGYLYTNALFRARRLGFVKGLYENPLRFGFGWNAVVSTKKSDDRRQAGCREDRTTGACKVQIETDYKRTFQQRTHSGERL